MVKGWQQAATDDPEVHKLWQNLFRENLWRWGIPTGKANNILVLDVDVKGGGLETIKTLQIPNTMSQRTISGGLHYIFQYPSDGRHYPNRVKFLPGLDIRGEGGYICYYGVNSAPALEAPQWLLEKITAGSIQEVQGTPVKVAPEIAEGIVLTSLEAIREAPEGESNDSLNKESFKLGQLVASGSITRDYAAQALLKAARERGKPDREAMATINSGLDGGSKKPLVSPFGEAPPAASFPLPQVPGSRERYTPEYFTREDLLNVSKLRKPQLFEHWSAEDITLTTADGGTGKTTLKLFEAICLALGERFLGFNCLQPGKTLFITGEDTAGKLGAMLGQIVRQMGLYEHPSLNDKVQTIINSIVVKKDSDLCLIVKNRDHFINPNGDAFRKIMEAVEDIKPKMIVFDPISSFWGSESALNDMAKAVTKFMAELCEQSGASVEMINHMGKVSSSSKDMTQFAGRGGTGLPSNSRICRVLYPVFEEEYLDLTGENLTEKQSAMKCNVNKFSDGSPLYNKPFLILREGFLFTRKILSDVKSREAEKQLSDTERVFTYIKEVRGSDKFAGAKVVTAHFMVCGNPIPEARTKRAMDLLMFQGHMGEKIKLVENPDQTQKDRVYVVTDMDGKES